MKRSSNAAAVGSLSFSAENSGQCCGTAELSLIGLVCSTTPAVRFPPATGASAK